MQRFAPIDGITQFVSGAGGHERSTTCDRDDARLAFGDDRHYGALRIDLRPRRARAARSSPRGGRVLDVGTVRCRPLRAATP